MSAKTTFFLINLAWLVILAIVALLWHISIRKLSKSCTGDDSKEKIDQSSTLSLWIVILCILASVALVGMLVYRAREGSPGMPETP
jgi:uncharacterized membrane protein